MKLRIYFSDSWHDSSSPCPWALCDEADVVVQSGDALLTNLPKADDYIAIIAASRLNCVSVTMPSQSRRRWEAALPFVAEEFALSNPEENHVVPGVVQKNGQRSLFIVDKQWLKSIVSTCLTANITLRRVIPEMLLPNLPAETWVLIRDGEKGFMRTGISSGTSLDLSDGQSPPITLSLALKAALAATPSKIQVRFSQDDTDVQADLPQWPDLPCELVLDKPWDWRSEPIPNDALNLLWGSLAPKARLHEWLPKFRPLALILIAVLFIETLGTNIEWAILSHENTTVRKEMVQTFRKTFGASSAVVKPNLQMQRNISALRHSAGLADDADFLPLLDQASATLSSFPSSKITSLHYESGRLDLDVKLATASEIRALQQRLQSKALSVRLGEIRNTGNAAETRLSIQIGGAS